MNLHTRMNHLLIITTQTRAVAVQQKVSQKPSLTQLTNDPDGYPEVDCNHIYTELSQDTDKYSAHGDVEDIETEIVSMECTEMYITTAQGSFSYIHEAPGSIPGTNTPMNTVHKHTIYHGCHSCHPKGNKSFLTVLVLHRVQTVNLEGIT